MSKTYTADNGKTYKLVPGLCCGCAADDSEQLCKELPDCFYKITGPDGRLVHACWQEVKVLAKHQPCGCVVCTCEDDERCQGCGAMHCGTHPVGEFPNPCFCDNKRTGEQEVAQ